MKHILAMASVGAAAIIGCAVEPVSEEELLGQVQQAASCGELKYQMEASLAVAVANELGRWRAQADFRQTSSDIQLTQTGLDRCAARGKTGCPNVSAILKLQTYGKGDIPGHYPDQFRNILDAHYQRQMDYLKNNKLPTISVYDLNYESTTSSTCGPLHWFKVQGESDPNKLRYHLIAWGATPTNSCDENPYIGFQSSTYQVGVDPESALIEGQSTTSSGSCSTDSMKVDCSGSVAGKCCYVNGKFGTYQRSWWDRCTYICK